MISIKMVLDNLTVMSVIDELVDDVQSNSTNVTDFPDYDINDSFNHFEWAELAPVLVVYTLTFFLGLIGKFNIFVLLYMYKSINQIDMYTNNF